MMNSWRLFKNFKTKTSTKFRKTNEQDFRKTGVRQSCAKNKINTYLFLHSLLNIFFIVFRSLDLMINPFSLFLMIKGVIL